MSPVCLDKYTKAQLISKIKVGDTKYSKKKELEKLMKPELMKLLASQMRKKSSSPKKNSGAKSSMVRIPYFM